MIKKVVIPVDKDKLGEYFGVCDHYQIFGIEGKITCWQKVCFPLGDELTEFPGWLETMKVTDVISHRIDAGIIYLFASKKINLFIGVPVDSPGKLIDAYMKGTLKSDDKIIKELTDKGER